MVREPARVCIVDDPQRDLSTGLVGSYGGVTGTPLAAAFAGRVSPGDEGMSDDVQAAAGYLGEALILEATPSGFGIARLNVELGARHAGVTGAWTQLSAPDVAVDGFWPHGPGS